MYGATSEYRYGLNPTSSTVALFADAIGVRESDIDASLHHRSITRPRNRPFDISLGDVSADVVIRIITHLSDVAPQVLSIPSSKGSDSGD